MKIIRTHVSLQKLMAEISAKTINLPSDPADQSLLDSKLGVVTDTAAVKSLLGYQNSLY